MGMYPNVAVRRKGTTAYVTEKGRKAKVHASSINSRHPRVRNPCTEELEVICYHDMSTVGGGAGGNTQGPGGANLSMLTTTPLSLFGLLLCCGDISEDDDVADGEEEGASSAVTETVRSDSQESILVVVDGWLRLRMRQLVLRMVMECRHVLRESLQDFLRNPAGEVKHREKLDAIAQVLTIEQPDWKAVSSSTTDHQLLAAAGMPRKGPPAKPQKMKWSHNLYFINKYSFLHNNYISLY